MITGVVFYDIQPCTILPPRDQKFALLMPSGHSPPLLLFTPIHNFIQPSVLNPYIYLNVINHIHIVRHYPPPALSFNLTFWPLNLYLSLLPLLMFFNLLAFNYSSFSVMTKFYCDYCDTFLTHDSPSVRKTHNTGRKHKEMVRMFYQVRN